MTTAVVEGVASVIDPFGAAVAVFGLAFVSAAVAVAVAFFARAHSREPSPVALNVLAGLGGIALWLNLSGSLGNFIQGETQIIQTGTALVNLASITVRTLTESYGGKLGDRVAVEFSTLTKASYDGDVTV